jgi:hypothetical protein
MNRVFRPGFSHPADTNIYAEIDLEMKAKSLAKCEVNNTCTSKQHWRDDPALMKFLRAL